MLKKVFKSKIFKIILVIVVAIAGFTGYKIYKAKKTATETNTFSFVRTVTLTKGSLDETVTSTGKIESTSVSNVTTNLKYEVKEIYVQVGDTVKAGDSIVQLDTSEIDKQITKALSSNSDSLETLQENYDSAVESKDAIWAKYNDARTAFNTASADLDTAERNLEVIEREISAYQSAYDEAATKLESITNTANKKYNAYLKAIEDERPQEEIDKLKSEWETYTTDTLKPAETDVSNAKEALNEVKSNLGYSTAEQELSSAQSTYDKAKSTYETYQEQINSANAKVDEAKEKLSEGVTNDSLEDLYESKEDCTLKAKTDGVVTSLNATVGSTVSDSTVATIQNTNALQLSLTLDEYDIQNVKTGMKAIVTSDALDKEFDAVVTQIDPIASSSQNSSGFGVTVTITSSDITGLKVGMSAEVDIIISSTDDVYTVPLDAIETKEDGKTIIYVQNDDGEFDEVEVTVGEQTDYYAEISGSALKEGMVVRASANEDESSVEVDASEAGEAFGNMGGMGAGGGDMPSGGGDMPSGGGGQGGPSGGGPGGN